MAVFIAEHGSSLGPTTKAVAEAEDEGEVEAGAGAEAEAAVKASCSWRDLVTGEKRQKYESKEISYDVFLLLPLQI